MKNFLGEFRQCKQSKWSSSCTLAREIFSYVIGFCSKVSEDESAFGIDGTDVLRDVGGKAFVDGVGWSRSHVGQEGSDNSAEGYFLEEGVRVGGRECGHRDGDGVIVGPKSGHLQGRRWLGGGESFGGGVRGLRHDRRRGKAKKREESEGRSEQGNEYSRYRSHVTNDGLTKDCVFR